jgi:hypothetical protein
MAALAPSPDRHVTAAGRGDCGVRMVTGAAVPSSPFLHIVRIRCTRRWHGAFLHVHTPWLPAQICSVPGCQGLGFECHGCHHRKTPSPAQIMVYDKTLGPPALLPPETVKPRPSYVFLSFAVLVCPLTGRLASRSAARRGEILRHHRKRGEPRRDQGDIGTPDQIIPCLEGVLRWLCAGRPWLKQPWPASGARLCAAARSGSRNTGEGSDALWGLARSWRGHFDAPSTSTARDMSDRPYQRRGCSRR